MTKSIIAIATILSAGLSLGAAAQGFNDRGPEPQFQPVARSATVQPAANLEGFNMRSDHVVIDTQADPDSKRTAVQASPMKFNDKS